MTFYDLPIGNLFTLEESTLFPLVFKKLTEKQYLSADKIHKYPWTLGDIEVFYPTEHEVERYNYYADNIQRR